MYNGSLFFRWAVLQKRETTLRFLCHTLGQIWRIACRVALLPYHGDKLAVGAFLR
ncbi:MAG: hypothetical protein J1E06_05210 [Acutalibacter sp.]|nr:hypothetical protein [Acutalibacter sp.]